MYIRPLSSLVLFAICGAGCAAEPAEPAPPLAESADALTAGAPGLPAEVAALLRGESLPAGALDKLYTVEHRVPVGPGRKIHLTETFTLRSWLRWPHRTALMLPGPLTPGDFYQIDVEGYRGRDILAKRGFFAVTADFEGTGGSTFPTDGKTVTLDGQALAMHRVVEYLRIVRLTPKVDVIGESWGGGVAAELCADRLRVRACVLASMLYKTASPFADASFRSPAFRAFLDTLPNGYFPTAAPVYAGLLASSPTDVQTWASARLPGTYTTRPLYDVFDLPFFTPNLARAPGLIVQGELDPNQALSDTLELAADYGTAGAALYVVEGGGHIPRIENPPSNTRWWGAVLGFLDP